MYRHIIFCLINILLVGQSFSQIPSIDIKSPLVKKIAFKSIVSKNDKEMYDKCIKWKLSSKDVYRIFSLVSPITSEEKAGLYNWLPCYFRAKVTYKGCIYTMEVNAASFLVLYNNKTTLYFGCSSSACERFFVLAGGSASSD